MRFERGLRHIELGGWPGRFVQGSQVAQSGATSNYQSGATSNYQSGVNYLNLGSHIAAACTRRASISKKSPPIKIFVKMSRLSQSEALRLCSNTSDINVIIDLSRYLIDNFTIESKASWFDFSGMIVLK